LDTWCTEQHQRDGSFKGLSDVGVWFRLATQLLTILRNVHNQRIIHGDIWPPNIMVDQGGNLSVIDFGEAWKFDTTLDRVADTSSSKRHAYLAPERLRSDLNPRQRWYSPADIYSIGGVLFYLGTGQQPPSPFHPDGLRKNRDVKQEIIDTLREVNPGLYLAAPGIADIISVCLHPKAEDRVSHISPILDTIDLFMPAQNRPAGTDERGPSLSDITQELVSLMKLVRGLRASPAAVHPVFRRLTHHRIQQLRDEISSLNSNLFILEGDR
jgi:serine/threonine protein kinase